MKDLSLWLRDAATVVVVAVPLLVLAALGWATRNPEHPGVAAARAWPVLGGWIEWVAPPATGTTHERIEKGAVVASVGSAPGIDEVRRSFTDLRVWFDAGTEIFADPTAAEPHTTLELPARLRVAYQAGSWVSVEGHHQGWIRVDADPIELAELPSQHRTVWVRPGDRLRASAGGEVVEEVDVIANLPVTATGTGNWVQVVYRDRKLWKRAPEFTGGPPPLGSATRPIRPLAAVAITPERLQSARSLLMVPEIEAVSGPYRILGDSLRLRSVAAVCDHRLAGVDTDLARVTGVTPLAGARETLLLFADRAAYREFVASGPKASTDPDGYAVAAQGFAATHLDGVSDRDACSVLVHEAVHLASRRCFGPGLPPWLAEGLATWLEGRPLGPVDRALGRRLVRLDDEFYFDDAGLDLRYRQAAAITGKLLTETRLAPAARAFLVDRANGRPLATGPSMMASDFWTALVAELGVPEAALWRMLSADLEPAERAFE